MQKNQIYFPHTVYLPGVTEWLLVVSLSDVLGSLLSISFLLLATAILSWSSTLTAPLPPTGSYNRVQLVKEYSRQRGKNWQSDIMIIEVRAIFAIMKTWYRRWIILVRVIFQNLNGVLYSKNFLLSLEINTFLGPDSGCFKWTEMLHFCHCFSPRF